MTFSDLSFDSDSVHKRNLLEGSFRGFVRQWKARFSANFSAMRVGFSGVECFRFLSAWRRGVVRGIGQASWRRCCFVSVPFHWVFPWIANPPDSVSCRKNAESIWAAKAGSPSSRRTGSGLRTKAQTRCGIRRGRRRDQAGQPRDALLSQVLCGRSRFGQELEELVCASHGDYFLGKREDHGVRLTEGTLHLQGMAPTESAEQLRWDSCPKDS